MREVSEADVNAYVLERLSWLPNVENAAHRVAEAAHGNAARARKMIEQILTHLDPEGGR